MQQDRLPIYGSEEMPTITTSSSQFGVDIDYAELSSTLKGGIVPVGSVLPWLKTLAHTPSLPYGWVELTGQVLSDAGSVYNGDITRH